MSFSQLNTTVSRYVLKWTSLFFYFYVNEKMQVVFRASLSYDHTITRSWWNSSRGLESLKIFRRIWKSKIVPELEEMKVSVDVWSDRTFLFWDIVVCKCLQTRTIQISNALEIWIAMVNLIPLNLSVHNHPFFLTLQLMRRHHDQDPGVELL